MANEKNINSRIQLKHDVEASWTAAGEATKPFIPKVGEAIVYDPDTTYNQSRVKIGDGKTNVKALPFVGDEKVTQAQVSNMIAAAITTTLNTEV